MKSNLFTSEFLQYLATHESDNGDADRIPSLGQLSDEMGISVAKLREQLEVARTLGFVEVRPRTGIRRKPYNFFPAITESLLYAIALDRENFEAYTDLRNKVEAAYWCQAVSALTPEDHARLQELMASAWRKLEEPYIAIPHQEHRELHQAIFSRLENPFVNGIIQAYWLAYEAVELNMYADITYLRDVWNYHQEIVDAICAGETEKSRAAFVAHTELLRHRPHERAR